MSPTKNTPDPRRLILGGGWHVSVPDWVRATIRYTDASADGHVCLGFRIALPHRQSVTHTKGHAP